jgi:hypothetical protein
MLFHFNTISRHPTWGTKRNSILSWFLWTHPSIYYWRGNRTHTRTDPQQQIYSVQTEHMHFEITWQLWACSVLEYHLSKHLYVEQLCSQWTLHKHVHCKNLVLSEDSSPWIIILSWQQKSMWYQKDFGSNSLSPGKKKKQSKASGLELDASKEALNRNICQVQKLYKC